MVSQPHFQLFAGSLRQKWATFVLRRHTISRLRPFKGHDIKFRRDVGSFGGPSAPIRVGPSNEPNDENDEMPKFPKGDQTTRLKSTLFKMFESAATTFMSIVVLG